MPIPSVTGCWVASHPETARRMAGQSSFMAAEIGIDNGTVRRLHNDIGLVRIRRAKGLQPGLWKVSEKFLYYVRKLHA